MTGVRAHSLSLGGLRVAWDDAADGPTELALIGELDSLSAPVLQQAFDTVLRGGTRDVVLDLAELTFVDSSGISALVTAWRRCQRDGGHLAVHQAAAPVRRLLEMTGVADLFAPPS